MSELFTESVVEDAALGWLKSLGWSVAHGPEIAPDTSSPERTSYGQVVLEQRLRDSLARLNSDLPAEALYDAFRKLAHPEGPTLETRNRAFHRMLVDGVTVEYRASDGVLCQNSAQPASTKELRLSKSGSNSSTRTGYTAGANI